MGRNRFRVAWSFLKLICFLGSGVASSARADLPVNVFRIEQNGVTSEIYTGEYQTREEMEETAQGLSAHIEQSKNDALSGNFHLELGVADFESGRGPSQVGKGKPSSQGLHSRIKELLAGKKIQADHEAALDLDKAPSNAQKYYAKFAKSRWNWVALRLTTVGGLVYLSVMNTPGPAEAALSLLIPSFVAITFTAYFGNELNDFQKDVRSKIVLNTLEGTAKTTERGFTSLFEPTFKKIFGPRATEAVKNTLARAREKEVVSEIHGFGNFYVVEVAFSEILNYPKQFIYRYWLLPNTSSSQSEIFVSSFFATISQGAWENAVGKIYEAAAKKGLKSPEAMKVLRAPLQFFGSVFSVVATVLINSTPHWTGPKLLGYGMLGVLGAGSVYLGKKADSEMPIELATQVTREATRIQCESDLGGNPISLAPSSLEALSP